MQFIRTLQLVTIFLFHISGLISGQLLLLFDSDVKSCDYDYEFKPGGKQQIVIESPKYPQNYPEDQSCYFNFTSPKGTNLRFVCNEFFLELSRDCHFDSLTLSLSGDQQLKRDTTSFCGDKSFNINEESVLNQLTGKFVSDGSNPPSSNTFRFQCQVSVVNDASDDNLPNLQTRGTTTTTASTPAQTCSCGRNGAHRIVGGKDALVAEFPWRVLLQRKDGTPFCGGTIINQDWILTAGHCIISEEMFVNVGEHDTSTTKEAMNYVVPVDRFIRHPKFNARTLDNDIALLYVSKPMKYKRSVQPVCLPWELRQRSFENETVTASGWGLLRSGGSSSPVLRKVNLPLLTTEQCRRYYTDGSLTENMFCTYSAGKDACQYPCLFNGINGSQVLCNIITATKVGTFTMSGDSGGSIDYKDAKTGKYNSIGVISWGIGCALKDKPGVYAKVVNYLDWILDATGGEFCGL